jgi:uncharacterized protein (TIGR00369 family)
VSEPERAGLLQMRAMIAGKIPAPPIAKLLGFELVEVGPSHSRFVLEASERHANPMGTLHGGVLCDVGDAAMGCAMATTINEGETYTTLELKINFLKPIWHQKLTAVGKVVKRTSSIGYTECEITDEKGSLVAKLTSTCLVLRGDAAKGR